jgi:hypothetical protein
MVLGYRFYEPYGGIFRKSWHYIAHFRSYDLGGDNINNGIMIFNNWQFENYYWFGLQASYNFEAYSRTLTRGGPMAKNPSEFWIGANLQTDDKQKVVGTVQGDYWRDKTDGNGYEIGVDLEWKPNTQLNISFGPFFEENANKRQWVDAFEDEFATSTFGSRYVFAELNHRTIGGNIRLNWTFTPQLSLQVFLQPLFSVGNYSNFKQLQKARSLDYMTYGNDGSTITYSSEDEIYSVDPDGDGDAEKFTFENPDFNFKSLRGNIVLRYEVLPGSVFFFVWTHDKTNFDDPGDLQPGRDFRNLWNDEANNIFLVKFSYWFDM